MFLHVSVILFTGGSPENPPPGQADTPPSQGEPPRDQADPPGPGRTPPDWGEPPQARENPPLPDQGEPPLGQGEPPPPRRKLQHTVNEWPVRILLECILVLMLCFSSLMPDLDSDSNLDSDSKPNGYIATLHGVRFRFQS